MVCFFCKFKCNLHEGRNEKETIYKLPLAPWLQLSQSCQLPAWGWGCLTADGRTTLKRQLKQLLTSCANILSLTLWYSSSLSSIDLLRLSSLNGCILFCWTEKRNQEGYPSWAVRNLLLSNCQLRIINVHLTKWSMESLSPSVPKEAAVRYMSTVCAGELAAPSCFPPVCK